MTSQSYLHKRNDIKCLLCRSTLADSANCYIVGGKGKVDHCLVLNSVNIPFEVGQDYLCKTCHRKIEKHWKLLHQLDTSKNELREVFNGKLSSVSASNINSKKRSRLDHYDSDKAITNTGNITSCNELNRPKKICLEYMNKPCQSEQVDSVGEFIPFSLVDNNQGSTPITSTPTKTNSSSAQPKTVEVKVGFYILNLNTLFGKKC